jgi:glycosyltransferase involved in cell wall biosynthesis
MRVALVTETFPPEVNGVAMTLHRLVTGLVDRGHRVEVIRPRQHKADEPRDHGNLVELTVPGLPLPRYDGLHVGLPAKSRLLRRWRTQAPEVVHIATEGPLGITALWAARKLGIPCTSSFHTNFHQYGRHYGYGLLARGVLSYLRHVHNRTCCTMAPSDDICTTLRGDGFQNVMLLARGVDSELYSPTRRSDALRQQWGLGPADLVAIYVGRVAGEKNIPLAIEAFEAMKCRLPAGTGSRLVIVGDGPARPGLEARHPEHVYAGMKRGDELATHYASGDVFLFPSTTETFGNVVTEAMASGLCVVAYDYAAPQQFIRTGENGVTAAFGDAAGFIAAAERVAADPPAARRMGEAARQTVAALSWHAVIDRFEGALQQAADQGQVVLVG